MNTIEEYMKKQAESIDNPIQKTAAPISNLVGGTIGAALGLSVGKGLGGTVEKLRNTKSSSALDIVQATEVEEELKDILERINTRRKERGATDERHRTLRL